ncbi:MAG: AHH domain-containing protein, partial [Planctomycetaceae bacterium]|nr:AHH domain-containing protein [Planctomycetaceae bacterium]
TYYEKAEYYEQLIANETYDDENGWILSSIVTSDENQNQNQNNNNNNTNNNNEQNSYAEFDYELKQTHETNNNYSRTVFNTLQVVGADWSTTENSKTEHQDITHVIVDGAIVRETEGTIIETNKNSSGYSGTGYSNLVTNYIFIDDPNLDVFFDEYLGISTSSSEYITSTSESHSSSYEEKLTTSWSNKINDDALVFTSSQTAELTTKTSGNYEYNFSYSGEGYFDSYVMYIDNIEYGKTEYVEHSITLEVAESYESELVETWVKNSAETTFSLDSRIGTYEALYEEYYEAYSYYNSDSYHITPWWMEYDYLEEGTPECSTYYVNENETISFSGGASYNAYADWSIDDTVNTPTYANIPHEYPYEELDPEYSLYYDIFIIYERIPESIRYNNFTNNGAKDDYSQTTTAKNDVTNIEPDNLENPFSQYTPSYLIAIDGPKLTNKVDEIPTFNGGEFFVIPELPDQSFTINTNLPSQPDSGNTSGIRQIPKSVIGQIFEFGAIFCEEIGPAYSQNLDNIQTTLDVAGFTPIGVVTDPVNGGIHLARGNYSESALSMVAAIPVIGDGIKAGATAAKTGKEIAEQATKHGDNITKFTKQKPIQNHHFSTNKNLLFLESMKEVADKYNLKLDGDWNKEKLPHLGRHTNAYHEEVLRRIKLADYEAQGDVTKFLDLYEKYIKKWVRNNPDVTQINPK